MALGRELGQARHSILTYWTGTRWGSGHHYDSELGGWSLELGAWSLELFGLSAHLNCYLTYG